jgi:hypothetical protein
MKKLAMLLVMVFLLLSFARSALATDSSKAGVGDNQGPGVHFDLLSGSFTSFP